MGKTTYLWMKILFNYARRCEARYKDFKVVNINKFMYVGTTGSVFWYIYIYARLFDRMFLKESLLLEQCVDIAVSYEIIMR